MVRCLVMMTKNSLGCLQFINLASGSNLRIGMLLESCTAEVQLADKFILDGRAVTLIDTPGFDDTSKSDVDILKMIAAFLATASVGIGPHHFFILHTEPFTRYEAGSTLAGVIYIHRISDIRYTGISGRNFKMFRELCGDTTLKNVIIVTNMWGQVSKDIDEARENQLSSIFFKPALDKGARMARHNNTIRSTHSIIRRIMENHPVALQIQRELVDEHKDIVDTAAGRAVNQELDEQMRRHQTELKVVQEEMAQALKEKDEETRQEMEERTRELQEQMEMIKKNSEGMASSYAAEKERMEARMKEMELEARRERAKAEYNQQLTDKDHCLQDAAEQARLEQTRWHEAELKRVGEMMQGLKMKDEETRQKLEERTKELQEQMKKMKKDSKEMEAKMKEREREVKEREREREAKRERERVEAEYNRQLADRDRRLQDAADQARLEQTRWHEAELNRVQEEMVRVLREKDEEAMQKLEERTKELQEQMEAKMNEIKQEAVSETIELLWGQL